MSLSPNRISSTATVSFSLMIGTTGLEQRRERVARVVGPGSVGEIGVGEEHLRDREVALAKGLFVESASARSARPRPRLAARPSPWGAGGRAS